MPAMTPTKHSVHTISLNLPVIPILQMAALRFRKVRSTEPKRSAAAPSYLSTFVTDGAWDMPFEGGNSYEVLPAHLVSKQPFSSMKDLTKV